MSEFRLAGLTIETPLINAAGSINGTNKEQIRKETVTLAETAIGAITIGSITVPEQLGNEDIYGSPVYHYDDKEGATYNSMGLPNIGLAAARKILPELVDIAHANEKPLIVSVSPTKAAPEIGDTYEQIDQLVREMLEADADLIEINTSCPNIVTEGGTRKPLLGYDLEGMRELIRQLAKYKEKGASNLGVKLPPYLNLDDRAIVPELASLINESGVFSFAVTANTIPNQVAFDSSERPILSVPEGKGGKSGPATKFIGRSQLKMWRTLLDPQIDIISTLGVDSGEEVAVRRQLGAKAAGGVTFLWESSNWGRAVTKVIEEWAES